MVASGFAITLGDTLIEEYNRANAGSTFIQGSSNFFGQRFCVLCF